MKKKIGTIYNKPIIIGDKNLKTNNEVHISELAASSGGSGSGESGESGESFTFFDVSGKIPSNKMGMKIGFIVKIADSDQLSIMSGAEAYATTGLENISTTWIAMGIPHNILVDDPKDSGFINSDELIPMLENELGWTRITKEQFYSIV